MRWFILYGAPRHIAHQLPVLLLFLSSHKRWRGRCWRNRPCGGYDHWNWDLKKKDGKRFPLITLKEFSRYVKQASERTSGNLGSFVSNFAEYMLKESESFKLLEDYYPMNDEQAKCPSSPSFQLYSVRFLGLLLWQWFHNSRGPSEREGWKYRSEMSGVWYANSPSPSHPKETLRLPNLDVSIPGPCQCWTHIELKGSLFGDPDDHIGKVQLRIIADDTSSLVRTWESLLESKDELEGQGFTVRQRRPGKGTYSALTKSLKRHEFRRANLLKIIKKLTPGA